MNSETSSDIKIDYLDKNKNSLANNNVSKNVSSETDLYLGLIDNDNKKLNN